MFDIVSPSGRNTARMSNDPDEFRSYMISEATGALFDEWYSVRRRNPCVKLSQFDPMKIPAFLPQVYMWQLDPDRLDFTGRLFGENFVAFVGGTFKGRKFTECHGRNSRAMFENHLNCLLEGTPFLIARSEHEFRSAWSGYEAMILPISDKEGRPAMLIGSLTSMKLPVADGESLSVARSKLLDTGCYLIL